MKRFDEESPKIRAMNAAYLAGAAALLNLGLWMFGVEIFGSGSEIPTEIGLGVFTVLALTQLIAGFAAWWQGRGVTDARKYRWAGASAAFLALPGWFLGGVTWLFIAGGGYTAGRTLRLRGRQILPKLRGDTDKAWCADLSVDDAALDDPTRVALEALWLHDAQTEHASVPAFSRISWLLAGLGAPARLIAWSHRAAIEEVDHARLCFGLASSYGRRSHAPEPMPALLAGLDLGRRPLVSLARESLIDGGQNEGFNADVARMGAASCVDPAAREVLETLARDEREHAEFSWSVVEWALGQDPRRVAAALATALDQLRAQPRPQTVNPATLELLAAADPDQLAAHGRLGEDQLATLWDARLRETTTRLETLLRELPRALMSA